MAETKNRQILTPTFRVSFPSLAEKNKYDKYAITMIFEADEDLSEMKKIIEEAVFAKWGANPPSYLRKPFRRGVPKTEENPKGYDPLRPEYEGRIMANASNGTMPALRRPDTSIMVDATEIYSGCYAKAVISAYAHHNKQANAEPGVSFNLLAVQKVADGERLAGIDVDKAANDMFTPVAAAKSGNHSDMLNDDI